MYFYQITTCIIISYNNYLPPRADSFYIEFSRKCKRDSLDNSAGGVREKELESDKVRERNTNILCVYVWSVKFYREMQKNQDQGRLGGDDKSVDLLYPFYIYFFIFSEKK